MTFQDRLSLASTHEEKVLRSIRKREWWVACAYGQGMLSSEVRNHLRRNNTPLRWHPDILAVRSDDRRVVYGVDAKTEQRTDTAYFSIEKSALAALHGWYSNWGTPVVIVWGDGSSNFTWDLLADDQNALREGPYRGNGSGTSFWLWPKNRARPFDDIFGENAVIYGVDPHWSIEALRNVVSKKASA